MRQLTAVGVALGWSLMLLNGNVEARPLSGKRGGANRNTTIAKAGTAKVPARSLVKSLHPGSYAVVSQHQKHEHGGTGTGAR